MTLTVDNFIFDIDFQALFESLASSQLRKLVLFENFNPQYLIDVNGVEPFRFPIRFSTSKVSRAVANASLKLEHLSASFMVDASYFFQACKPSWNWSNLTWLALTSRLLSLYESPVNIDKMLIAAAVAAMKMPNLQTMEIWNGEAGLAMLFRYQRGEGGQTAVITRKGMWEYALGPDVIQAWEAVALEHRCSGCIIINEFNELMRVEDIHSHGHAIHYLKLSNPVIRPISLLQIRIEHEIRTGIHALGYIARLRG